MEKTIRTKTTRTSSESQDETTSSSNSDLEESVDSNKIEEDTIIKVKVLLSKQKS